MSGTDWKTFLIPYDQAVEELKVKLRSIRTEYRRRNEYSPIEFITGRVKEISSMLEKANKFNIPHDRLRFELEDIAGIRIMCQFVDDIETVVNIIRKRSDMQIMYEKDYISNVKPSGYRSYHVVIKYPVNMAGGVTEIIAEIQIRTLAMNFWAVTEHSLNYKYKAHIPEQIRGKLKTAAESAYQLDQVMMDIKDEIKDAQKLFEVKSAMISSIMSDILSLMSMGRSQEAARFQVTLNKLIEYGGVTELNELQEQVKRELERHRQ
ncbi:GTP pyrophosphokinase [Youngiibacter fragilis]|uniref:GTP pyrophosphokinase n=1 Tax=Youngiibacter fragilis 232.1 TaxID=994573 RepID=V7I095_9CLOT|nr:GTP pyrophosphokinase family protein [Youngiibacter fragilis]ETA79640.1 GTP pyrophosphokinase [Youngiibacter fragilis 232.1]